MGLHLLRRNTIRVLISAVPALIFSLLSVERMFLTAVRASFLVLRYQEVKGDTCGTHILIWRQNCLVETAIQTRLLLGSLLVFTGFYSVFYILNHVGSYGRKSTYCFYGTKHEEGAAEQADLKRLEFLMIAKKKRSREVRERIHI